MEAKEAVELIRRAEPPPLGVPGGVFTVRCRAGDSYVGTLTYGGADWVLVEVKDDVRFETFCFLTVFPAPSRLEYTLYRLKTVDARVAGWEKHREWDAVTDVFGKHAFSLPISDEELNIQWEPYRFALMYLEVKAYIPHVMPLISSSTIATGKDKYESYRAMIWKWRQT